MKLIEYGERGEAKGWGYQDFPSGSIKCHSQKLKGGECAIGIKKDEFGGGEIHSRQSEDGLSACHIVGPPVFASFYWEGRSLEIIGLDKKDEAMRIVFRWNKAKCGLKLEPGSGERKGHTQLVYTAVGRPEAMETQGRWSDVAMVVLMGTVLIRPCT